MSEGLAGNPHFRRGTAIHKLGLMNLGVNISKANVFGSFTKVPGVALLEQLALLQLSIESMLTQQITHLDHPYFRHAVIGEIRCPAENPRPSVRAGLAGRERSRIWTRCCGRWAAKSWKSQARVSAGVCGSGGEAWGGWGERARGAGFLGGHSESICFV